jgi:hypothetical protein
MSPNPSWDHMNYGTMNGIVIELDDGKILTGKPYI